jgi:hypothetical protein
MRLQNVLVAKLVTLCECSKRVVDSGQERRVFEPFDDRQVFFFFKVA